MKRKPHITEIKAFAAFDDRGNLLYATIRPTKEAATEALERMNSRIEGLPYYWRVMPVFIGVDLNFQLAFDLPS